MHPLPRPLTDLIEALQKLPGVGERSAMRFAFFLVRQPEYVARALGEAATNLKKDLKLCATCKNISDTEVCPTCSDVSRDIGTICVVEDPIDLIAMERTGTYRGRYHVLHGALNPMNGITEEDLTVADLLRRVESEQPKELILATNVSLEGEATALLIARRCAGKELTITRLGRGLPTGSELSFSDPLTLHAALLSRQKFGT